MKPIEKIAYKICQEAIACIDTLSVALTNHEHQWTGDERTVHDTTMRTLLDFTRDYEGPIREESNNGEVSKETSSD